MKNFPRSQYNFVQKFTAVLLLFLFQTQTSVFALSGVRQTVRVKQVVNGQISNQDILEMIKTGVSAEIIIAKIKNSDCKFDTSPTVISDLKKAGVPDSVILAMIQSAPPSNTASSTIVTAPANSFVSNNTNPTSTASTSVALVSSLKKGEIKVPDGTPVEVELTYTVSSDEVQEGSTMSFRTIRPVKINGVTIIESGTASVARVRKAKGGGSWGKSGQLEWAMQGTTAVDNSNVPLQFERKTKGQGKGGQVATGVIVTALLGGGVLALLWGFKKGKSAKIPAGTRFEVFTFGDLTVQTGKSAAEMNSLSSGVVDLNGTWSYNGQFVQVSQQGNNVFVSYVSGKASCSGTTVDYVFQGQIQGSQLVGKMPTCAPPEFVKNCALPSVNELSFAADISYGKISGTALVPQLSITPALNGTCSILRAPRQDQEFPFLLSRMINAE